MEHMINHQEIKTLLCDMQGGCSAFSWETADKKHLWGRNFDFNRIAQGSKVTFVPRGTEYNACGTGADDPNVPENHCRSRYAAVGVGSLLLPTTPILYEGVNEKGVAGGQLYYRDFAFFPQEVRPGTAPVQPPFFVTHALAQCKSLEEIVTMVEKEITPVGFPVFGTVPTIHWIFTDRTGETIIIEPDKTGISVYRNTMGVMTNSPGYPWHRLNLLNYFNIRNLDYDTLKINGDMLTQCFSGNGAAGLPGDWSSPSRFIRLSFLKKYGVKGINEEDGISKMLHLFGSVAFPLGMIEVSQPGAAGAYDTGVIPYDYTIYTSLTCLESLRFYWTTYENQRVECVDLTALAQDNVPAQFDLNRKPDFRYLTK